MLLSSSGEQVGQGDGAHLCRSECDALAEHGYALCRVENRGHHHRIGTVAIEGELDVR